MTAATPTTGGRHAADALAELGGKPHE
ncbi:Hypothetical protein PFREUD_01770 [Propionibacterium freudenreichii subsp. shermanii CIRM-BIA1]|uniref:Uncharacterized protein n=1 Tax=Propionibacterium freudenreichii subsp. shermanii (strain ATCC 9614 / DSM 4902 / CIP 103027 / NCIMB 8099 / CIRM-BIA1) TaxID=754252 RepID=D7GHX0_PROFC|nr:Hypothetical protein PFREUD_01770 [Propionibacterium freudenreichii subsp. shermanii CIRM-BIA1]